MSLRTLIPFACSVLFAGSLFGQGNGALGSLKRIRPPQPPGLDRYVRDNSSLVVLGKALFWDMQAGSDGKTACATCHFHAGADHRTQNQLTAPKGSSTILTPNRSLTVDDFPFHKLADPNNNRSAVVRDTRQVFGSSGVVHRDFFDVGNQSPFDQGADVPNENAFTIAGVKTRQVTARNTPTVINSVFNVRNFWDGRANTIFTGATPFGDSDTRNNLFVSRDGQLVPEKIRLENSSLASQAAGPPLNDVEMSYTGRTWYKFARKMLALAPLGRQKVSTTDGVFGVYANPDGKGLLAEVSYLSLIQAAFQPALWESSVKVDSTGSVLEDGDGFSQTEANFSIFYALSIQAYEATLISDDSRFDQFMEGQRDALTAFEQQGLRAFQDGGSRCTTCHSGPEFTAASYSNLTRRNVDLSDPDDVGFFRTNVSPVADDPGLNDKDTFGNPFFPSARAGAANGVFKSPSLRNIELTGPYFHDGGQATLEQVVEFYGRQGDFPANGNQGVGINNVRLSQADRVSLVAFMKALTDERVRYDRAPFDHPELCIPNGHAEVSAGVLDLDNADPAFTQSARDKWALIPASGKEGHAAPLQTFEELLRGIGVDGSRSHTLAESCTP